MSLSCCKIDSLIFTFFHSGNQNQQGGRVTLMWPSKRLDVAMQSFEEILLDFKEKKGKT